MKTFVWDSHFTTGLTTVDEQHHRLVDLINELGVALLEGREVDGELLEGMFGRLTTYARLHFDDEEQIMTTAGIDPRAQAIQRRHHVEFIEQVSLMWRTRGSMARPGESLRRFLSAWLGSHILGEDQDMARQIAEVARGVPPEVSFESAAEHRDNATDALLHALDNLYQVLAEQNRDLARSNTRLEERVAQRTLELAKANEVLTVLSKTDALMGIANRGYFDGQLATEWRRALRDEQPLGLLMMDVDHFKGFNDTYGHQAGDACLQAVARAAQSALRRPGDFLARYGGEELVAILPNTAPAGARTVAETILGAVATLHLPHSSSPVASHVTLSIGVACTVPVRDRTPEELVAAADRALYAAKAGGRNRVVDALVGGPGS